jgi:steroid delta-isomerase-like uncharacterized protein
MISARRLIIGMSCGLILSGCKAKQEQTASGATVRPVVEAYVSAWNRHDSAAFDTLLAADAVHEDIAHAFVGKGPGEIKGYLRDVTAAEPDFNWQITKTIENGPNIVAEWKWTGTYSGPAPSGRPVTNTHVSGRGASVIEVENGKIKHFTDYYDDASFFPKTLADSVKR